MATLLGAMPCIYERCVTSISNEQLADVFNVLHGAAMMPMRDSTGACV